MIYPTFNQYRDKLKADKDNINDSILRNGTVIMDRRNIFPYLITGGRAIIFKIKVGNKLYALKCWNAELSGLEKRFREIDSYLKTISLPYFVDFSFNKNGFKNGKELFPILRMEWVDGCTLTDFVIKNCSNKTKIKNITQQFLEMVQKLHTNNISHGDLQGGNIMVRQNGNICLIDYDSICTPNLQNEKDNIAGLGGFQHPLNKKSLGLKVDYFSELVIYLSLLVFSENKNLAQNIDDKQWLFSENDLKNPNSAPIFKKLMTMSSDIQNLTKHLMDYCKTDATKLQPLESIIGTPNNSPWNETFSKQTTSTSTKPNSSSTKKVTNDWDTFSKPKATSSNKKNSSSTDTNNWNTFSKQTTSTNSQTGNGFLEKKYCSQCGSPYNKPTSIFCSYCGKKRD